MSKIRSKNTSPERRLCAIVAKILGKACKIRRNVRKLPGYPDVVIPSLKLAILADGCFYHCCPWHGHIPHSNRAYWVPKLQKNRKRDEIERRKLRAAGFYVWKFWEHDLKGNKLLQTYTVLVKKLKRHQARLGLNSCDKVVSEYTAAANTSRSREHRESRS